MTVSGKTLGDNCRRRRHHRRERDPPLRAAAQGAGRLPRPLRQHLPLGGDEDERGQPGVPRPLPLQPDHPNRFEGRPSSSTAPRTITTASTTRALAIDAEHPPLHARRRPEGLSRRRRGGEHARPRLSLEAGDHEPRLRRRRPAVGHLRLPLDPERQPRGGLGRRARAGRDRRPGAGSISTPAGSTSWSTTPSWRGGASGSWPKAATASPTIRRPGRRSSATSSATTDRRGAGAGGQVPAHRPDHGHPARQSLIPGLSGFHRCTRRLIPLPGGGEQMAGGSGWAPAR